MISEYDFAVNIVISAIHKYLLIMIWLIKLFINKLWITKTSSFERTSVIFVKAYKKVRSDKKQTKRWDITIII